jgi:hypothetical protein
VNVADTIPCPPPDDAVAVDDRSTDTPGTIEQALMAVVNVLDVDPSPTADRATPPIAWVRS